MPATLRQTRSGRSGFLERFVLAELMPPTKYKSPTSLRLPTCLSLEFLSNSRPQDSPGADVALRAWIGLHVQPPLPSFWAVAGSVVPEVLEVAAAATCLNAEHDMC